MLHQWKRKILPEGNEAFVGKVNLKPEDAEMRRLRKELEDVREKRNIFKKTWRLFQTEQMKYRFMEVYRMIFRIRKMCKMFKTFRSGYYALRNRAPSIRQQGDEQLLEYIWESHRKSRRLYGSPKITSEFNDHGLRCGKNRVVRIMKDN